MSDIVQVRKDAPSGTIVLNRPDRRNALSREIVDLLIQALEDLNQENSVRAIILTGTGSTFCSGTDLHQLQETSKQSDAFECWHADTQRFLELLEYLLSYPKPILACINGWAVGSGVALMLAADMVIAGENSQLLMPEAHRGLSSGFTAPLLAFRIGTGLAGKILMSGLPHSADEAQSMGLFHEVVSDNLIWARCQQLAEQCASGARESHQMTKQFLNETVGEYLSTQLAIGAANTAAARTTAAASEGISAFLEKRQPDWSTINMPD